MYSLIYPILLAALLGCTSLPADSAWIEDRSTGFSKIPEDSPASIYFAGWGESVKEAFADAQRAVVRTVAETDFTLIGSGTSGYRVADGYMESSHRTSEQFWTFGRLLLPPFERLEVEKQDRLYRSVLKVSEQKLDEARKKTAAYRFFYKGDDKLVQDIGIWYTQTVLEIISGDNDFLATVLVKEFGCSIFQFDDFLLLYGKDRLELRITSFLRSQGCKVIQQQDGCLRISGINGQLTGYAKRQLDKTLIAVDISLPEGMYIESIPQTLAGHGLLAVEDGNTQAAWELLIHCREKKADLTVSLEGRIIIRDRSGSARDRIYSFQTENYSFNALYPLMKSNELIMRSELERLCADLEI